MSNADIRGRFIWHELMTTDPDAAGAFYSKVVPWKTQPSGMPSYTLWMAGKTQIGGLMALPDSAEAGAPSHWIVYIATPDVDATVEQAQRLGGKVLKSAADIPNVGRFAVLTDPQGATFAVYTPAGGAPAAGGSGSQGEFTWHELATTDHVAALRFYSDLFGWEKGPTHDMGAMGIYQIIDRDGAQVGGLYNVQSPSTPPHWLSYVRVADVPKATAAAKAAGGRVLNGPHEVPGGSWITMLMDPQGGAFAIVEPPKADSAKTPAEASKPAAKKAATPTKPKGAAKGEAPKPAAAKPKAPTPVAAKKAAKKAGKTAAKKPVRARGKSASGKAGKKTVGRKTAGRRAAARKRPGAKRAAAKRAPAKSIGAKRGKTRSAAGKRAGGKSARGKSAKRR
jgi:predicted enzyme related to lactoylglutathione lyase